MYLLDSTIKHLNNRDLGIYYIVWSEIGLGLEIQVAHPHQEFPGVPPPPPLVGADNTL